MRLLALVTLAALLAIAAPLAAHHAFAAEYDVNKPATLKGVVTKVDWMNPHVFFYVDVEDASGKVSNWACEMGPPAGLQRSGWSRHTIKFGDEVIVNGSLAKDGSRQINARTITMAATGKRLGAMSSENTSR